MSQRPFSPEDPAAPAVFGAGAPVEDEVAGGSVAYLPSAEPASPGCDVTFHLYHSESGEPVLPAFTSLDALVAVFGESQAWVGIPHGDIEKIRSVCGARQVVWDAEPQG